jgi:hypothetical protein
MCVYRSFNRLEHALVLAHELVCRRLLPQELPRGFIDEVLATYPIVEHHYFLALLQMSEVN